MQRNNEQWTDAQRQWLADGLRHTNAKHILIEFKYSESFDLKALQQLVAYDYFYRVGKNIKLNDVACFLIVAKTPLNNWQQRFNFVATPWPGVYRGTETLTKRVRVVLLNELTPTAHNAPLKCFASRDKERKSAFAVLANSGFANLSAGIEQLVLGLRRVFMPNVLPANDLTPELVMAIGQELIDAVMNAAPLNEILKRHKPDEVLSHYNEEQILAYLKQIRAL